MPTGWPAITLGRVLALLVLIFAVISLVVTVNVEHLLTWLVIALALALLVG